MTRTSSVPLTAKRRPCPQFQFALAARPSPPPRSKRGWQAEPGTAVSMSHRLFRRGNSTADRGRQVHSTSSSSTRAPNCVPFSATHTFPLFVEPPTDQHHDCEHDQYFHQTSFCSMWPPRSVAPWRGRGNVGLQCVDYASSATSSFWNSCQARYSSLRIWLIRPADRWNRRAAALVVSPFERNVAILRRRRGNP